MIAVTKYCWGRKVKIKDVLSFGEFARVLGFVFDVILLLSSFKLGFIKFINYLLFLDSYHEQLTNEFSFIEMLNDYASLYHSIIAIHLQTDFQLCNERHSF